MELVLLHGFDSNPGALLGVAAAVRARFPSVLVRLLAGPVRLPSGTFAWWNDDPSASTFTTTPADALAWITPRLRGGPVVVAGMSQGGALALAVASARLENVVGVASVGGFAPDNLPLVGTSTPLFIAHGESDEIVDVFHAESLARTARRLGISTTLDLHPGGHAWTEEVTEAFLPWMATVLPPPALRTR